MNLALVLFSVVCCLLMLGFPVAFTLAGVSFAFAAIGMGLGFFDPGFIMALPDRVFGIMTNQMLMAVPLFVLMGVLLEKSKIAENMLKQMAKLMSQLPAGLGLSVIFVGSLLAASTGIVGATVVTMGLISLPAMLKANYPPSLATGLVCATGTLGQIIPPSIALVLLADILSSAYSESQLNSGVFSPETLSVGELFVAAVVPGLILVFCYLLYLLSQGTRLKPSDISVSAMPSIGSLMLTLLPPLMLIFLVLGTIILGVATPTEAAAVGAFGALILAKRSGLTLKSLENSLLDTVKIIGMIFMILVGAACFSLVFRGLGGDEWVQSFFHELPGGAMTALFVVMLLVFLLGFILDFIEIIFVVVPIVGPPLMSMGVDPLWFGILLAINLQTSFSTPPFGFALFYLRGVADKSISTSTIYKGVIPFIGIQLSVIILVVFFPELVTWLPDQLLN